MGKDAIERRQDIIGKKFGRLTAISFSHMDHHSFFKCRCECGKFVTISRNQLQKGESCGCYKRELLFRKGELSSQKMVGKKFGRWSVLRRIKNDERGRHVFECQCECGTIRPVVKGTLHNRHYRSCGCYQRERTSDRCRAKIEGKKVGYWRVIKAVGRKNGKLFYECICKCGNKKNINSSSLLLKRTKSCGCMKNNFIRKANSSHGMCGEKVYYTWVAMKSRCYNPKHQFYKYYGGSGIKVFKKWKDSFVEFYKYVGDPPSSKHSIDRVDNKKDYAPGNVRWATPSEQANNKRNNRRIAHNGKYFTLAELSKKTGIKYGTLKSRLNRSIRPK